MNCPINFYNLNNTKKVSFGRALKTNEKEFYKNAILSAKKTLEINNTSLIVFDTALPRSVYNDTGIGTSFSEDAQEVFKFIKDMLAIDAIQFGPQGNYSGLYLNEDIKNKANVNTYAGTSFSLGFHLIDLTKLASNDYGSILAKETLEEIVKYVPNIKPVGVEGNGDYWTRYDYLLGDPSNLDNKPGTQRIALDKAWGNFSSPEYENKLRGLPRKR